MTALENVIEGPVQVLGIPKAKAIRDAGQLLEQVGLADQVHKYPSQMSGGSSSVWLLQGR